MKKMQRDLKKQSSSLKVIKEQLMARKRARNHSQKQVDELELKDWTKKTTSS